MNDPQITELLLQSLEHDYEDIEEQEDDHIYRSQDWKRDLLMDSLGMEAALPAPEEGLHV